LTRLRFALDGDFMHGVARARNATNEMRLFVAVHGPKKDDGELPF
jgi:hypothetical protein